MPILTCPKCQERYDPDIDNDFGDLPDNSSRQVVCPKCGQWVRLPGNVPVDAPDSPANINEDGPKRSRSATRPQEPREQAWGDAEDRPRRRRRGEDDQEEGDRDREFDRYRPWVDQAAEDYSDAPGGRGRPMDGLGMAAMIIGIFSCAIALAGFICCPFVSLISIGGGIAAVIMGFLARRRPTASGMAVAGLVTGFIAVGVSVTWIAITIIGIAGKF